jgi:DNA-binding response OmpR family regulator
LCRLLADYLQREGFMVEIAHDGEAALMHLRNAAERADLPVLDVPPHAGCPSFTSRQVSSQQAHHGRLPCSKSS